MKHQLDSRAVVLGLLAAALAAVPAGQATAPRLSFSVLAHTAYSLDAVVWNGHGFLYVQNTANTVWSTPSGKPPLRRFAQMPRLVEETRCIPSPASHGFSPGVTFCHSPDNRIYELSAGGATMRVFARLPLPSSPPADGALGFDSGGAFGYRLIVATGRSGAKKPSGGLVYAVSSSGQVQRLGGYPGPGGADELVLAPPRFGSAAGDVLLAVDAGASGGAVVAMDPHGRTRTLARFPHDGPNPIAVIPRATSAAGHPAAGLYVTDDLTHDVYFAPAADFAPFAGDVIVAGEISAHFSVIEPSAGRFRVVPVAASLSGRRFSLEGATFVAG